MATPQATLATLSLGRPALFWAAAATTALCAEAFVLWVVPTPLGITLLTWVPLLCGTPVVVACAALGLLAPIARDEVPRQRAAKLACLAAIVAQLFLW